VFFFEAASMPVAVTPIEWAREDGRPGTVSAAQMERLYSFLRKLPGDTVIAEFPFGVGPSETRAVYLSTRHGHPIVNGYSGGVPPAFARLAQSLADPFATGEPVWQDILHSGATCLVVHEWAFAGSGPAFSAWLEAHGARPLVTVNSDRAFLVPR
jgi:hypothetical protein